MGSHHQVLQDLRGPTSALRHAVPDAWAGFAALHGATMTPGELSTAVKEAVALAISVVKRCDGCIAYHARGAAKAGATPGQVAEMLAVALLMDGGTASVYAPRAWEAFLEMQAAEGGGAG